MPASNTYDTSNPGSATGNREDLANWVTTLAPTQTPVLNSCTRATAEGVTFGWMVDALAAVDTSGIAEGTDATSFDDKFAGRARLTNNVVEKRKTWMVTGRQQAVNSVGPADFAQAQVKATKEIKRDIEAILLGTQDKADEAPGTPSMTRGLGDWIDSAGPADVPAAYRTPAGSIHSSSTFTETVLKNIITSIYRQDGVEGTLNLYADTALRRVISGFAETSGGTDDVYRQVVQNADGRLRATVSYYESDHGVVRIVNMNPATAPDTTNKDTGYFIPDGALVLKELDTLHSMDLPDLGGGPRGIISWTGGLATKHPGMLGKITAL